MSRAQEASSTLLIHSDVVAPTSKELKEALDKGDVAAKIDALKKMIVLQLNGESQNHLIMSVIKFCVPQDDHTLKKLLIYFWEVVEKTDATGKLLPEMILLCSFIRSDLQHPNEYIRGFTLRFLCKMKEKDILEPLVSAVVANLTHRVTFVRRNAVLAVQSIYTKFPVLLPDAPDLIEKFLQEENDVSSRRNAFNMLFSCSQERAIRYLEQFRETQDLSQAGDVFHLAVVDVVKQLIQTNPAERGKYIPLIFSILQSKSPAVQYQCACTLLALSSSPTAIKHAAATFIQVLTMHSDNNVRLIVLDRLDEMKEKFRSILQESLMELLRSLATGTIDLRRRVIGLSLSLVNSKNIEAFVQFMKKELVRSQGEDVGDKDAQQEYRQELVKALHTTVMKHTHVAPSVVTIMLDYICESGPSAYDVIVFIREVMQTQKELRKELLDKMAQLFQMIASPKVLRTVLWLFGVHCTTIEQIAAIVAQLKQVLAPLPLTPPVVAGVNAAGAAAAADETSTVATTTVREDGTYVMNIALVSKRTEVERSDLTGLRAQITGGDFFLAATLANTLAKLTVALWKLGASHHLRQAVQSDSVEIMHELIRYGTSKQSPAAIDDDSHERIRLALTVAQNPHNAFVLSIVDDSVQALEALRSEPTTADGASSGNTAGSESAPVAPPLLRVDQPMAFTQLSSKGRAALLEFEATADDVAVAVSNDSLEKEGSDFLAKLHRVVQLSGFGDPIYTEALVTVHQFDILVEMFVVNQTADTLQNLTVELATVGDLKLCERPQTHVLPPYGSVSIRANIKVSSTETGLIFGSIVYDSPTSDRNCVILNEIRIDIMDYIKPGTCSQADFRAMWTAFEWENRVVVDTDITDLREFVQHVTKHTNMRPLDAQPTDDCGYLSCSLYAKSLFGEDALANVSIESGDDGKISGVVRIRSKTQGIALGLGDIVSLKQMRGS